MRRLLTQVLVFASISLPASLAAQNAARTLPQALPVLEKLSFSKPNQDGWILVTGQAGAVSLNATVFIQCLETGALFRTTADETGAFTKSIPAPSGSTLVINYGARGIPRWKDGGPALQVTVNSPASKSDDKIHFTVAGGDGQGTGYWIGEGVQNGIRFERGDRLEVEITFRYYPSSMPKKVELRRVLPPQFQLCRFSDAEGRVVQHSFVPTLMTPTGLPIFSNGGHAGNRINLRPEVSGVRQDGKSIVLSARYILPIDDREAFATGHFFGRIHWRPTQIWPPGTGPKSRGDENDIEAFLQGGTAQRVLPVFRIAPARRSILTSVHSSALRSRWGTPCRRFCISGLVYRPMCRSICVISRTRTPATKRISSFVAVPTDLAISIQDRTRSNSTSVLPASMSSMSRPHTPIPRELCGWERSEVHPSSKRRTPS